jgi:GTP cyclohydrolase FolE2
MLLQGVGANRVKRKKRKKRKQVILEVQAMKVCTSLFSYQHAQHEQLGSQTISFLCHHQRGLVEILRKVSGLNFHVKVILTTTS